ncbi:Glycosyltransferase, GT2 family [Pseudarthrobacter equi]|uniref:Glycosyltransferase, GT2 family n=1 Tax=Pseudarthrobacter equi TaxID=728066 RepID=A0A1H2B3U9_9MICC|nr:glycosyltransferase family 2 protein [Pseudarthrobacter equi]SDT52854.1 Glycosyltransferase, GT2 family [Pseudarthrobacter equi]
MQDISAIIVAYHSEDLIVDCVNAALASGLSQVIVWDNADDQGSLKALSHVEDSRLMLIGDETNEGFGGAINKASKHCADAAQILLINPDCFVTADVVQGLCREFDQPETGIVAPRMTYENGQQGIAGGPYPSVLKEFLGKLGVDRFVPKGLKSIILSLFKSSSNGASYYDSLVPGAAISVDWVSGFCMMIRAEAFREVAGFDSDYFLYFEDVDICRRATEKGYSVKLVRNISALHLESTSTIAAGKSRHYYQGLSVYLRKHGTAGSRLFAKTLGLVK